MKLIIIIATFLSLNVKAENFPALFQNFSGICINSLDNLEVVYDYAKKNNWKILPEEAKDLVRPADGSDVDAWAYVDNDTTIIIGISIKEVDGYNYAICSMAGKGQFKDNFNALVNSYDLELYDRQKQGIQVSDVYFYEHPGFSEAYITTLGSTSDNIKTFSFSVVGIN